MNPHKTIRRRLYFGMLAIIILVTAGAAWYSSAVFQSFYYDETRDELRAIAERAARALAPRIARTDPKVSDAFCKAEGAAAPHRKTRFTVVLLDGRVVGDSERSPADMVNHWDRPEIQQALATRDYGTRIRFSTTLGTPMMYVAVPLTVNGDLLGVVRISRPLQRITAAVHRLVSSLLLGGALAAAVGGLFSIVFARRISRPLLDMQAGARRLANGEFDFRLGEPETAELAVLARALNEMGRRLNSIVEELTRERNELRAVLASMGEGLIALDPEQCVLTLNDIAADILGIEPVGIRGKPLLELTRAAGLIRVLEDLEKPGARHETEIVLPGADSDRVIHIHGASMKASGGIDGAVLVLRDVTRLRRLEQARRDFVANVSHELKTPLTSLRGFIETLRDGALDNPEDARRFLDILDRQSARMQAIIEDLLLLARLERETDEGTLERQEHSARAVIDRAMHTCRPKADTRNIPFEVSCPDDLRLDVSPGLIEQALVNLIDNAVTYSPEGAAVTIEAESADGEVLLRVRDHGCGIPHVHLSRIFQRFYRVDKARSRDAGGTGLGLAIVKHVARVHRGRVEVESAPGKGSTFTIHLPLSSVA